MAYSPAVEKWRPLVEKYFPPELVDKALYVIQGESGGNATITGDGGNAIGLFQIHHGGSISGRPDAEVLLDPEQNIKYAAKQLGAASGNWAAWGENNLYEGKPFGALGNNPYPGAITNARANVAGAIKSVPGQAEPTPAPSKNPSVTALGLPRGKKSTYSGRVMVKPEVYQPTGDYATDAGAYWQQAQDAYAEYNQYANNSDKILIENEEEGTVFAYNSESDESVLDPVATKIYRRALSAEQSLDRLYSAKKAGLIGTGADSASAYLSNEKEKFALASDKYDDYVKRISDLVAVEDIPRARSANLASILGAYSRNKSESGRTYAPGYGTSGQPQRTDLQQFATSMRNAIPKEAPQPYNIDPAAMASYSPDTMKFPARPPEEILNEFNAISGGGMAGAGVVQPPIQPPAQSPAIMTSGPLSPGQFANFVPYPGTSRQIIGPAARPTGTLSKPMDKGEQILRQLRGLLR